jgi:hypothetical protein
MIVLMPTMEQLLKKLAEDKNVTVEASFERQKAEWLADLARLFTHLKQWLAPGQDAGTVSIDDGETEIAEEDLGPYRAPTLKIRIRTGHPRTVIVEPKGMRVVGVITAGERRLVGASGRVDLTSGPSRAMLLRFRDAGNTTWKIILDDGTKDELSSDSFANALGFLINTAE